MNKQNPSYERYQRQILLKDFGEGGQQKLAEASVLVIGAGGLGCPALQYLTAAGIGRIGLVDDDVVSLHNLHRQVLYTTPDVGTSKVQAAATRLQAMNPEVQIDTFAVRLSNQNALSLISDYAVVVDATDNFLTRYIVNDACVLLNKPLVYGAISQYEGQVAVFNVGENAVNYRDLFPQPPHPGSVLSCAEAGVLGVLPGLVGTMQATEVIKLLTGLGKPLVNQLFTYNALTNESLVFSLATKAETATLLPQTPVAFAQLDYAWFCGESAKSETEIEVDDFDKFLRQENTAIVDVRERGEQPEVSGFLHRKLPLSQFNDSLPAIEEETIVFFCQSGKRSREAAKRFAETFGDRKKVYSLKGGIINWIQHGKKA